MVMTISKKTLLKFLIYGVLYSFVYNLQANKAKNRQMLHQSELAQSQKNIQRSLDHLQTLLPTNNLPEIIPAFYYTADLLKKYSQETAPDKLNLAKFREFKGELENFAQKDFTGLKKHEREILDQMLGIVNSDAFIYCLQPEIKESRINSSRLIDHHLPKIQNQKKVSSSTESDTHNSHHPKYIYQSLYNNLLKSYEEHRIDQAHAFKNQYLQSKYPVNEAQKELFNTIQLQYTTMISFYKQFDLDGWIFDKQDNGVTLQYKIFEAEKQIAIRIASEFDVSVQNFLSILTEVDLMGTYIPFTYDSKQLKVISRNEKIGTSKIYIPCLTDRQTYFYAAGYDRMKVNGSIFLFSKTINEDKVYQQKYDFKVPQKSDYIRLEYKFFIVEYIPITRTRAKVRLASKIDMKLNFLPQFILNMSARKFAFDYFKNIIKVNKNFKGSAWQQKIKENPEFYGFFKSKVEEYMGKK